MCGTVVRVWVARYHQSVAILIPCSIELVMPKASKNQSFVQVSIVSMKINSLYTFLMEDCQPNVNIDTLTLSMG